MTLTLSLSEDKKLDPRLVWCREKLANFADYHDAVERAKADERQNRAKLMPEPPVRQ